MYIKSQWITSPASVSFYNVGTKKRGIKCLWAYLQGFLKSMGQTPLGPSTKCRFTQRVYRDQCAVSVFVGGEFQNDYFPLEFCWSERIRTLWLWFRCCSLVNVLRWAVETAVLHRLHVRAGRRWHLCSYAYSQVKRSESIPVLSVATSGQLCRSSLRTSQ